METTPGFVPGPVAGAAGLAGLYLGHTALVNQFDEGDQDAIAFASNPIFAQLDIAEDVISDFIDIF